ncbi:MAG: ABC transporter ATP-binding protein [Eubacteriales bacterium]|mgnify:CR=1 FL=1|nr:ABC transporter ATP-binding protein [Eubacteriales bacterium]MDD3571359.1 ABC transporter ATP-binding protein [Eubacteriales bacterium]MDD4133538.1 ABC transporter ATP-binding protein [Eubacteriales bacterium]NLV59031.1 ABC transporter ATP-binding protein [Clostridiales bacterium]
MLEIKGLHVHYGYIHALKGIDLSVGQGEIVTLIGANGAGKSTTLNAVCGLVKASAGSIHLEGEDITNKAPYRIVQRRVSQAPEGREVFPMLTVNENLRMGAFTVTNQETISRSYERVFGLFPRLKEREKQIAGTLSGGEQQMLAIGRALMSSPKLLLLDEPSMGLAPNLVLLIFDLIKSINEQGVTILLIEQNANIALSIAKRAYVLETGNVVLSGEAASLRSDPAVQRAYLGG